MPLKFYVREFRVPGTDEVRYMAQSVNDGQVKLQVIAQRIADKSALTEGDVMSCITELFKEITSELLEGHSVKLDNFGTFQISMKAVSKATAAEVDANSIESFHITFRPAQRWYETMKPTARFQKVVRPGKGATDDDTATATDTDTPSTPGTGGSGTGSEDDDMA